MRRFLVAVLALAVCSAATPPDAFSQLRFRNVGPQVSGGRLGAVAGTDADSSLYYAGAAGGGVWKSTNAGASWSPVFDRQDVQAIGAVTIDPSNEQTVWVGTGEAAPRNDVIRGDGVYRTDDGGKTWRRVLALQRSLVARILIDPGNSQNVLVGVLGDAFADSTDRGVYRTADGGKTWQKTLYISPRAGIADMADSAQEPGVVYAGMWDYRRTGWSSTSGGPDGGLYKSTDFGVTWTRLRGNGLPSGETGRIAIAVAPSNPKRVFALIESKQGLLWRSDDGGTSWTMVSSNTLIDERPFYYTHVFVDPTDENHLWTLSVHVAVSSDGGQTWKVGARGVHGDNHFMWISRDAKRIIEANDGGPSFSWDDGKTWTMPHNLPIAQLYHVGYDRERPYHICAPLQDNGVWCAPNDGLSGRGISSSQWLSMGGGDGTFVMPDPAEPKIVWFTSGGGNSQGELANVDLRTGVVTYVQPYLHDQNVVPPKNLKYRFNWETPFAFDPFDAHHMWVGGNVLFSTTDRGFHWRPVSGDLTRNTRSHEEMTGGITLDVTGAETSETILAIEPSHARRGVIWVGTDDGLVQLTTDGGAHWKNVLRRGYGRMANISASLTDARTAYVVYDAHMTGDPAPHLFVTHDFGATWSQAVRGLPPGWPVRSVRVDPRNPSVVYAGTDNGLFISFDGAAHWRAFDLNLPATSVRDIAVQPDANDLLVATHGRAAYILDDITPLQQWGMSTRSRIFPVRPAYEWNLHGFYETRTDGAAPPYGATITFYLERADKSAHAAILDAAGHVIRRFSADDVSARPGFNRLTWDTTEDKPADWKYAPAWTAGTGSGAQVVPGTYTVVVYANGKTMRAPVVVRQDPRTHYTAAQLRAGYEAAKTLNGDFDRVDTALNMLSAVIAEAPVRQKMLTAGGNTALAQRVGQAAAGANRLLLTITQNARNDQDNDFLTDILRERLQTALGYLNLGPPPQSQEQQIVELHALTNDRMRAVFAFRDALLRPLDAQLKAAKVAPLEEQTQPIHPYDPGGDGER